MSQHGFATVEKGERYYKHADGTPFFWLGDTNWQAFSNVSTTICNYPGCDCGSQFEHMMNDRVAKGFTVYQTFVFDLGAAHKLTYITISPLKGTVIPHFRVSGSNDGIHWTVITDTSIRKAAYPGSGNEPLAGTYRYVKVLLLNPQNVSNASYETMTNPIQGETYSVTKITDVVIYTDGEGTPTPEILVGVPGADDPGTDTPGDETTETEAVTVPADTSAPAEDTSVEESDTVPNVGEKKGCGSVLGVRVVGLLTAIAACLAMRKSKERDGE